MKRIIWMLLCLLPAIAFAKDTDAIQKQYLSRLTDNGEAILKLESDQALNYSRLSTQRKLELLEVQYRGRVPSDVREARQKLESDDARFKEKISELEKERENLKLDALKYYRGKLPKSLDKKWGAEDQRYMVERMRIIRQTTAEIEKAGASQ